MKQALFGTALLVVLGLTVIELQWSLVRGHSSSQSVATETPAAVPEYVEIPKSQVEQITKPATTVGAQPTKPAAAVVTDSKKKGPPIAYNAVRGVDLAAAKADDSLRQSQEWKLETSTNGLQIRLASNPAFCVSCFGAHTVTTLHLWHCNASSHTHFRYDAAKKTLAFAHATNVCVAHVNGAIIGETCSGADNQQFNLPENSASTVITTAKGEPLVFTARTSFMQSSAYLGFFEAKVLHSDVYQRLNGSVQLSSHQDGAFLRVAGKRIANGVHRVILSSHSCKDAFAAQQPDSVSSSVGEMTATSLHAALFAFMPLTGTPRTALLQFNNEIIACAPLAPVVATEQIGAETMQYDIAMEVKMKSTGPSPNAWPGLGGRQEHAFKMLKEDVVRWLPTTPKSLKIASEKKITFALVCKNVGARMPATLAAIEEAGKAFKDYRVIILENNSNDNTGAVAANWAKGNPKVFARSDNVPDSHREENIARARNRALKVYEGKEYDEFNYLAFFDCDFEGGWTPEAVTTNFLRDDWDGVCSNGVAGTPPLYYYWDRYAWRDDRFPLGPIDLGGWTGMYPMRPFMLFDPGEAWVNVTKACFGGFAIYKREMVQKCPQAYTGVDARGRPEVEHIAFSTCLLQHGGTLMMNPSAWIRYSSVWDALTL